MHTHIPPDMNVFSLEPNSHQVALVPQREALLILT